MLVGFGVGMSMGQGMSLSADYLQGKWLHGHFSF